jgi:hypothetical protein
MNDKKVEKAWDRLKAKGINSEEELQKALKENPIEIGMFTMPYKKSEKIIASE